MMQISGELADEVKVPDLPRRVSVWEGSKCINKGFVICEDMELSSFQEVPEMFDSQIYGQEFSIIRTVACLCWF